MENNKALENLLIDFENIAEYYKRKEETQADYLDIRNTLDRYYKATE